MSSKPVLLAAVFAMLLSACSVLADSDSDRPYALVYRSQWSKGVDPRLTIHTPRPESLDTVAMPVAGGVALKLSMSRADDFSRVANGSPRAEIGFERIARFAIGKDYEIRWSTVIPADYRLDSRQPEITFQLHQGASAGSPPVSLMLAGGRYRLEIRGGPGKPVNAIDFGAPSGDRGKVVDWLLRYRPDDTGLHPRTDLYMNGTRVARCETCANAYPGDRNAYLKLGIYKWWWMTRPSDVTERSMYYGNVDILERESAPSPVAPRR
ncbi:MULTISPECIES: heparin lyase I family protein [unclassified Caballeronia]|uniref:heparin lyase I family protein n=1 Tax=unclassified Caballeronia TaxID=2646786 RepID=UPI00202785A5|nr:MULTISPECIES: heparin lyase I family protein [unclassified Caballeronia]MDR5763616.1 heparin lyase I family protein [Caballeronia sp. LZ028]